DFDLDASIQGLDAVQKPFTEKEQVVARTSSIYQTFTEANQAHKLVSGEWSMVNKESPSGFVSLTKQLMQLEETLMPDTTQLTTHHSPVTFGTPTQVFNTYILLPSAEKFYLI